MTICLHTRKLFNLQQFLCILITFLHIILKIKEEVYGTLGCQLQVVFLFNSFFEGKL